MKKKVRNAVVLVLCAVLLVAGSVVGTMAYLTSQQTITNTFTVGNVTITLDEAKVDEYGVKDGDLRTATGQTYKLIPGRTYVKDPTITVGAGSEDCWLFVKVDNGLSGAVSIDMGTGWTAVPDNDGWWYYNTTCKANDKVVVFSGFTFPSNADPAGYDGKTIVVAAYAIQADGFATYDKAWTALDTEFGTVP